MRVECLSRQSRPLPNWPLGLQRLQPEVVFNLSRGLGDDGETEAFAAGILRWLNIPFTGSPA